MASRTFNPIVLTFVTGNEKKLEEVRRILGGDGDTVVSLKMDLPELQGEPEDVARAKCEAAYAHVKGPVIIEDTSLCFHALRDLGGPYVGDFYKKLSYYGPHGLYGLHGLYKLLNAFNVTAATAKCIFAVKLSATTPVQLFAGETLGSIVSPRGTDGFDWDPIFQPDGTQLTFAELGVDKYKYSPRTKASKVLADGLLGMVIAASL